MLPSRRSRSARRPRWIRDFTVPERHPGQLGDLGVVVALDVEQDDGVALVGRDRCQRRVQDAGALALHRRPHRVGLVARRRLPALVLELRVRLATGGAS